MVTEHWHEHTPERATISPIAAKIGCKDETLGLWVRRARRDTGKRLGVTTDENYGVRKI